MREFARLTYWKFYGKINMQIISKEVLMKNIFKKILLCLTALLMLALPLSACADGEKEAPVLELCGNITVMRFREFEIGEVTPAKKNTSNEAEMKRIINYINSAEKKYSVHNDKDDALADGGGKVFTVSLSNGTAVTIVYEENIPHISIDGVLYSVSDHFIEGFYDIYSAIEAEETEI